MGVQNMYRLLNPAARSPGGKGPVEPDARRSLYPKIGRAIGRAFPPSSQPPGPAPLTRGTYRVIILTYEGVSLPVALFEER